MRGGGDGEGKGRREGVRKGGREGGKKRRRGEEQREMLGPQISAFPP